MERPSYNERYIHIGSDGYNVHLLRQAGNHHRAVTTHPCNCCLGFRSNIHCQYGPACQGRVNHIPLAMAKSDICHGR